MKHFLLGALFLSLPVFAQETLKLSPEGIKPVVVELEGKSATDMYITAKQWVNTYFNNPKRALKAEIENDMIRVDGYCQDCFGIKAIAMIMYDYSYTLEIYFKDGKYKYDVQITKLSDDGAPLSYTYTAFYKNDGSLRKMYQKSVETMEASLNETFTSFQDYMSGKTQKAKSDW